LIDVVELQVLLQGEEMLGAIVAGERGLDLGLGGTAAVVAMLREARRIRKRSTNDVLTA
jgi:hypothetical protein